MLLYSEVVGGTGDCGFGCLEGNHGGASERLEGQGQDRVRGAWRALVGVAGNIAPG